jgi:glycosyltransferase involved in cell wall biosynthesis
VKIAFIVQRYGPEVLGGAEHLCRLVAERLAASHDVEVLTTCARDYETWANEYPEGADRVRGVVVRRFPTARTRDKKSFDELSDKLFWSPHTRADEMEWLKQQGPWTPALIEYLKRNQQQYDVLVFFTYLYATTVLGLDVAPQRSVLVPTAHDEPAIRLEIFKEVFAKPAAFAFLTESERKFVDETFDNRPLLEEVIGIGIELPQHQQYPRMSPPLEESAEDTGDAGRPAGEAGDGQPSDDEVAAARSYPSHLTARGAVFRRRHRLHGPMLLYGGRIDPGKGCEELLHYFSEFLGEGGDATLVLMGAKMMSLPEDPAVRFAGMLSEREKFQALEAATVVVAPSPYESLSILALEAMAVGTPVLGNARSAVVVEHCVNSNAGLYYADRDEFVECLKLLMKDDRLRASMGRNGRDYVKRNYRWDVVLGKYERIFAKVRNAR